MNNCLLHFLQRWWSVGIAAFSLCIRLTLRINSTRRVTKSHNFLLSPSCNKPLGLCPTLRQGFTIQRMSIIYSPLHRVHAFWCRGTQRNISTKCNIQPITMISKCFQGRFSIFFLLLGIKYLFRTASRMVRKVPLPSYVGRGIPSQLTVCWFFPSQQLKKTLIIQKRMLVLYSFSFGLLLLPHMMKTIQIQITIQIIIF